MKITAFLFLWLAGNTWGAERDQSALASARDAMKQMLAAEIRYDPKIHEAANAERLPVAEDVIIMATLTVTENYQQRMMVGNIEKRRQQLKAEEFTWATGGTIMNKELGPVRIKLGVWPQGAFIPFLRFDW